MYVVTALIVFASGAALGGSYTFQDGAYHWLEYATYDNVYVYNNFWDEPTTVELVSGGRIGGYLYAYEDSRVIISGGTTQYLYAYEDSRVIISGGTIGGHLRASHDSNVTISAGTIRLLLAYENSNVIISGGTISGLNPGLSAYDTSNVTISGGSIDGYLYAFSSSNVTLSGGTIGGDILIYGTLTVDGQDFLIDGRSFPYGGTFDSGGLAERRGSLSCTLANGDLMAKNFTIYKGGSLVLIPEPATLTLLMLGALAMLKNHRH